ncbi:hypothetical protein KIW84_033240 [Lathyrus oleraceus]|uniref:Integrase catalytic domain-containing protein n=1 Tax=Pisum sativum TaxID=3888 RepID=A0A9D4XW43_PEA|nr:hypothetical protein KIW84_033240 [Pisum sativum]
MVKALCKDFKIAHHNSSPYRPKMNGVVEAANKNIKKISQKMVVMYKDWHEMLPFSLHKYRTSIHTSTGATPFSLVYGMEVVLPVEVEIPSLRVLMEAKLAKAEWCQTRFDQLNLIEERRLTVVCHVLKMFLSTMFGYDSSSTKAKSTSDIEGGRRISDHCIEYSSSTPCPSFARALQTLTSIEFFEISLEIELELHLLFGSSNSRNSLPFSVHLVSTSKRRRKKSNPDQDQVKFDQFEGVCHLIHGEDYEEDYEVASLDVAIFIGFLALHIAIFVLVLLDPKVQGKSGFLYDILVYWVASHSSDLFHP